MFAQSPRCILFGGLSLQEDCHYLLYPSVGMLPDASYELHTGDARRQASRLSSTKLVLVYLEIWSSMSERLSGVLIGVPVLLR